VKDGATIQPLLHRFYNARQTHKHIGTFASALFFFVLVVCFTTEKMFALPEKKLFLLVHKSYNLFCGRHENAFFLFCVDFQNKN
jgi:hypothetical protein